MVRLSLPIVACLASLIAGCGGGPEDVDIEQAAYEETIEVLDREPGDKTALCQILNREKDPVPVVCKAFSDEPFGNRCVVVEVTEDPLSAEFADHDPECGLWSSGEP